jgi:hypothetical protein
MPNKIHWTRSRVRRDGVTSVPEEILQEILMRLPPMSVLRCRAVCRGWRCLTSDPALLLANHGHQPTLNLISSFRSADRLSLDRSPQRRRSAERRSSAGSLATERHVRCFLRRPGGHRQLHLQPGHSPVGALKPESTSP